MIAEETFGEILGALLRMPQNESEVGPSQDDRLAARAQFLAGTEATKQIAAHFQLSVGDVWEELSYVPDHMLALLISPLGWTILGDYIAAKMGISVAQPFIPHIN